MEADLHIIGAFETLPGDQVTDDEFKEELLRRGLNPADAGLLLERGLLLGLLERTPDGLLRRGLKKIEQERTSGEPPATQ